MNKRLAIIVVLSLFVVVLFLCAVFNIFSGNIFFEKPLPDYHHLELKRILTDHHSVVIGKVVRNFDSGEALYSYQKGKSIEAYYKKYKATMEVLLNVKGSKSSGMLSFDYYSKKQLNGSFYPLKVGEVILYTPARSDVSPFWTKPFRNLDADGNSIPDLWYEYFDPNVDFGKRLWRTDDNARKAEEILQFLEYNVYNVYEALKRFEVFYGNQVSNDFSVAISTNHHSWIIQGKCNRLFGWGCVQKEFCYTLSSFGGEFHQCREYTETVFIDD